MRGFLDPSISILEVGDSATTYGFCSTNFKKPTNSNVKDRKPRIDLDSKYLTSV